MPRPLRICLISSAALLGLLALGFLGQALHVPPEEKWFSSVNATRDNPEFDNWSRPQIHWQPRDLDTLGVTCDLESDPKYVVLRSNDPWSYGPNLQSALLLHADAQGKITLSDGAFVALRKLVVFPGENQPPRGFSLINGAWATAEVSPEEAKAMRKTGHNCKTFAFFEQSGPIQSRRFQWPIETASEIPLQQSVIYTNPNFHGWDAAVFPVGISITLPIVIHHGEAISTTLSAKPGATSSASTGNIRYCGEKSGIGWKALSSDRFSSTVEIGQSRLLAFIHDLGSHPLSRVDVHLTDGSIVRAEEGRTFASASIFELKAGGDISHFTLHQFRDCARVRFELPPLPSLDSATPPPANRFDFPILPQQENPMIYRQVRSSLEKGLGMRLEISPRDSDDFQIPNTGQTLRELLVEYAAQCGYAPAQIEVDSDANVIRLKVSRWEKIKKWFQENRPF